MTKKNNLWKTNTIVIAAFKLLIIPRIFGLFPYWKDYSKNTIGVVYSVCVITLLMASGGYSIFTILTSPFGMSVDIILDTAQITIVHYTLIASILSSIFHRSEYVDAMDCLKDSSCYIRRNGSYITYNCYEPLILIVKLINIILGAFSLLATQRTNTYFIEIYIFFTTVSLVSIKQSEVNGLLSLASAQFDSSLRQLQVLGSTPFYRGKLTKIEYNVIIYTKLAKACEHFDNIYSTQFFMMTLSTILIKTASLFSFLKVYLHHLLYSSRMTFYSYINHFVLIAIFTVESILTVKACSSIKQKAEEFNSLLYSICLEDATGIIINNNKVKAHFARDRKVTFSALGFCPVDNTLLQIIASLVANYIVLLIQFGLKTGCNGFEEL